MELEHLTGPQAGAHHRARHQPRGFPLRGALPGGVRGGAGGGVPRAGRALRLPGGHRAQAEHGDQRHARPGPGRAPAGGAPHPAR